MVAVKLAMCVLGDRRMLAQMWWRWRPVEKTKVHCRFEKKKNGDDGKAPVSRRVEDVKCEVFNSRQPGGEGSRTGKVVETGTKRSPSIRLGAISIEDWAERRPPKPHGRDLRNLAMTGDCARCFGVQW